MSDALRIYVAGPMSGLPGLNFDAFHEAARRLRERGFVVTNPAEINVDKSAGWSECMRADLKHLVDCHAVATLPNWEISRGAVLEVHVASALGMRINSVEAWLS